MCAVLSDVFNGAKLDTVATLDIPDCIRDTYTVTEDCLRLVSYKASFSYRYITLLGQCKSQSLRHGVSEVLVCGLT